MKKIKMKKKPKRIDEIDEAYPISFGEFMECNEKKFWNEINAQYARVREHEQDLNTPMAIAQRGFQRLYVTRDHGSYCEYERVKLTGDEKVELVRRNPKLAKYL